MLESTESTRISCCWRIANSEFPRDLLPSAFFGKSCRWTRTYALRWSNNVKTAWVYVQRHDENDRIEDTCALRNFLSGVDRLSEAT